ncbi:MAG: hypothetical protein GY795_14030 [Desulfobacterales bacterium]|nr:hypothetical protein [Desulfobacterales bacterium]
MTLKHPEILKHEFLILNYPDMDFIINRNQFFTSIFLENTTRFESGFKHLSLLVKYHEQTLPVFDADALLTDIYKCRIDRTLKLALISDLATFSEMNRSLYKKHILKQHPDLSDKYIALKVNSHARIKTLLLSEIKLIPHGIRAKHNKEGILGCRFSEEGNIQYFLDIETIFFNCISKTILQIVSV